MHRAKKSRRNALVAPERQGNASGVSFGTSSDHRRLHWSREDIDIQTPIPQASSSTPTPSTPPPVELSDFDDDIFSRQVEYEDPYVDDQDIDAEGEDKDGGPKTYIDPRDVRKEKYGASVSIDISVYHFFV